MSRVYGDSSPFPYDLDYIQLLRDGVEFTVQLLRAQHRIRAAEEWSHQAQVRRDIELEQLQELLDRLQATVDAAPGDRSERTLRVAAQIVLGARGTAELAAAELNAEVLRGSNLVREAADGARRDVQSSVERFLSRHVPPRSRTQLRLLATTDSASAQFAIHLVYGVHVVFNIPLPATHPWARARRIADLVSVLELSLPKESGWLSKRVEVSPVRVERLFIGELVQDEEGGLLRLRRHSAGGSGYLLTFTGDGQAAIAPLRDDGTPDGPEPLRLEGKDLAAVRALWDSALSSLRDIPAARQGLAQCSYLGRPLAELESPQALAEAVVADMAPVAVEISRRSGAPGELVLRRNLGEGRREETYCTHAELLEKVTSLPSELQAVFAPLRLGEARPVPRESAEAGPEEINIPTVTFEADDPLPGPSPRAETPPPLRRPSSVPPPPS